MIKAKMRALMVRIVTIPSLQPHAFLLVRNRAKELVELLSDVDKIRTERRKAKANKHKYTGTGNDGGYGGGYGGGLSFSSGGSRYGGFGSDSLGGSGGGYERGTSLFFLLE
jgi:epsin